MNERQLAENICRVHAQTLVDSLGGATVGGAVLADKYAERLNGAGGYDAAMVAECSMALRHWVLAAGYNDDGSFNYIISTSILNC